MLRHIAGIVAGISAAMAAFAALAGDSIPSPALIPQPLQCKMVDGQFVLSPKTPITHPAELQEIAKLAAKQLGLEAAPEKSPARDAAINLALDASLPAEAYRLDVAPNRIAIVGGSPSGVFYGVQTLRQLVGPQPLADSAKIPCLSIEDQPRFVWRGLMVDCSRTFQSLDYLRKIIDHLAFYKMNVMHLHLTDDQSWRMEIHKHPELIQKCTRFSPKYHEPPSHEGFYTQAELKGLVEYAKLRGVTIVPEIEMPGHSTALLVCRPDLSCTGKIPDDIYPFGKGPSITKDILCAGNDDVFTFLEGVLDEVVEVFPSKLIHVGGDEAPKNRWKECPKCQARIKSEGIKDERELQAYLVRRIEKHLASKGRRLIGWDEILEGQLAPEAAVMSWRGTDGGVAAAKAGREAVMSPRIPCYFNYTYEKIDTQKVYGFDPLAGLLPDQERFILGIQANFWSTLAREPSLSDRQLFPRLIAMSERGWSQKSVADWPAFQARLDVHLRWLDRFGTAYKTGPGPH